jgi:anti-sigma factor RsiW
MGTSTTTCELRAEASARGRIGHVAQALRRLVHPRHQCRVHAALPAQCTRGGDRAHAGSLGYLVQRDAARGAASDGSHGGSSPGFADEGAEASGTATVAQDLRTETPIQLTKLCRGK